MSYLGIVSKFELLILAGEANVLVSSWSWQLKVSVSSQSRALTSRAHPCMQEMTIRLSMTTATEPLYVHHYLKTWCY